MDGTSVTLASEARVPTSVPQRYLAQLCKHFQHKLPVVLEEGRGRIEFPLGRCELDATVAETLLLRVLAGDEAALAQLEDVVGRHLERFAFREKPEIRWTRTAA